MNAESLASAIVGHLVGDYLLQNDWMALNKKGPGIMGGLALAVHSFIWAVCVCSFAGFWPTLAFAILYATHMLQDGTNIVMFWMTRINRQSAFASPPLALWSIIVVDNVWHILTIWIVWRFFV